MQKKAAPIRSITMLAPESDRDRKRRNGTRGVAATRSSMKAKAIRSTAATPRVDRVWAEPHGWLSVLTMP